MMIKNIAVWFNQHMVQLHEQLKKEGLTSQKFTDFVKDAYHDKIDDIMAKRRNRVDLSHKTIEEKTFEAVKTQ